MDVLIISILVIILQYKRVSNHHVVHFKSIQLGNSLVVQWLGLSTSTAGTPGSIPGRGTKIPKAAQRGMHACVHTDIRAYI